jgi:hypothetical protein
MESRMRANRISYFKLDQVRAGERPLQSLAVQERQALEHHQTTLESYAQNGQRFLDQLSATSADIGSLKWVAFSSAIANLKTLGATLLVFVAGIVTSWSMMHSDILQTYLPSMGHFKHTETSQKQTPTVSKIPPVNYAILDAPMNIRLAAEVQKRSKSSSLSTGDIVSLRIIPTSKQADHLSQKLYISVYGVDGQTVTKIFPQEAHGSVTELAIRDAAVLPFQYLVTQPEQQVKFLVLSSKQAFNPLEILDQARNSTKDSIQFQLADQQVEVSMVDINAKSKTISK